MSDGARWISDSVIDQLRDAADWPELGDSKYDVLEVIGRGGMGTVYRAHDRELGRDVAVKVTSAPVTPSDAAARMHREARTLARLEHPGIVPVHDVGQLPDGRTFYVMKLVRGTRLDAYARQTRSRSELLRAFERVCEAVSFAHAHGVIHRDLKPENVMVGPFGEALVMDWGVAKVLGGDDPSDLSLVPGRDSQSHAETAAGTVLGTPGYMAPEQARGAVTEIDARTDVYALGAMLYFLLTRIVPAANVADVRRAREVDPSIPRALDAIVTKAMQPAAGERYPSAASLAEDVTAFLEGIGVAAYVESPLERAWRVARKYRTPILLVIAYLVMRVALLIVWGR